MSEYIRPAIASGHPLVSEAAAFILRLGGNAFDAVIGAGFASAVVEPALTSLGGGGFLLAKTPNSQPLLYDFFVDTPGKGLELAKIEPLFFPVTVKFPGSKQVFNIGPGSVAVPGNLKGFVELQKKLGRLPLSRILEPAIKYAEQGTVLNHHQAYFLALLEPIMLFDPYGRRIYLKNGRFVSKGQVIRNPDLARFLKKLGANPHQTLDSFYKGEIARQISADMKKKGGLLTDKDLADYKIIERQPLKVGFSKYTLFTNPPPSFGGFYIALALELISGSLPEQATFGSCEHLLTLASAMKEVEKYRQKLGCSLKWPDETWFKEAEKQIRATFSRGTTHISVCDQEGNLASMTTSNGEGSGYYVQGTGIMLNNMMGEDDLHPDGFHSSPPGTRVASMMSPSILFDTRHVRLILGSGGSKRIRSAITQVIINSCLLRLELREAICNPRIHLEEDTLQMEPGFHEEVVKKLSTRFQVNQWSRIDVYFGGVHAVDPFGHQAQGDPRRGGAAMVLDRLDKMEQ